MTDRASSSFLKAAALGGALLLTFSFALGQVPQPAQPLLSPAQLDNLVAPIALYPDPLLGQVLAASTYPLEIVEADQWLKQNSNLSGGPLMDAAKQQNWDPSVQALVAFPDALRLLGNDVRWTTDLGNAFLAQQADVTSAIQRMRARAQANGRLTSTPQQVVTTETQDGQAAIEIQPANPQTIYVPIYQPEYVWGPPAWGAYPDLWYPAGFGYGFGFGPGIFAGAFFPGWGGWGGWGWGPGWFGHGLYVNSGFFNRYGFRGGYRYGGGFGSWAHDPGHRMGVPYPNRTVAGGFNSNRFNGGSFNRGAMSAGWSGNRINGSPSVAGNQMNRGQFNGSRPNSGQSGFGPANRGAVNTGPSGNGWRNFNGNNRPGSSGYANSYRQASPNYGAGNYRGSAGAYRAPAQSYQGYQSYRGYSPSASGRGAAPVYNRSSAPAYSAPRGQSYSAPRSFSAPHYSGGSGYSGARSGFSGGRSGSSGGSSGGHPGGGGHRR
jgi:hypothetical protein